MLLQFLLEADSTLHRLSLCACAGRNSLGQHELEGTVRTCIVAVGAHVHQTLIEGSGAIAGLTLEYRQCDHTVLQCTHVTFSLQFIHAVVSHVACAPALNSHCTIAIVNTDVLNRDIYTLGILSIDLYVINRTGIPVTLFVIGVDLTIRINHTIHTRSLGVLLDLYLIGNGIQTE